MRYQRLMTLLSFFFSYNMYSIYSCIFSLASLVTTTLYAILDKIIEMGGRNVVTLEDPIEIVKEHCLQIEMNESLGIDYYNSLKQILRHDPDVIMIGEIRDEKTAKLAITCALTGHLVLSTIHASNSLLVIKRMLNLGINETD